MFMIVIDYMLNEDWGFWSYLTLLELDSSRKNTQGVKQELNGLPLAKDTDF